MFTFIVQYHDGSRQRIKQEAQSEHEARRKIIEDILSRGYFIRAIYRTMKKA